MNMYCPRCLIVTTTLLITSLAGSALAGTGLKTQDPFPDLAAYSLEGIVPEGLRGKVVLIDFWASWCAPCKASFPIMVALHQRYAERGFTVVAINVDEDRSAMDRFIEKRPVPFPVLRDVRHELVSAAQVTAMPTSFLLDRDGKIRAIHQGYKGEETRRAYEKEIEELLGVADTK